MYEYVNKLLPILIEAIKPLLGSDGSCLMVFWYYGFSCDMNWIHKSEERAQLFSLNVSELSQHWVPVRVTTSHYYCSLSSQSSLSSPLGSIRRCNIRTNFRAGNWVPSREVTIITHQIKRICIWVEARAQSYQDLLPLETKLLTLSSGTNTCATPATTPRNLATNHALLLRYYWQQLYDTNDFET